MNLVAWAERNGVALVPDFSGHGGVARMTAWAKVQQIPVDKFEIDVGSALSWHRRTFVALLRVRSVHRNLGEYLDRLGSESV